jgi:hypothetical protein
LRPPTNSCAEPKYVSTPPEPDKPLGERLVKTLQQIATLKGKADITGILPLFDTWYKPASIRFKKHSQSALADVFFHRHRAHVLKLAVIYEVATSGSLKVTERSWKIAEETAKSLEAIIYGLLDMGVNAEGYGLGQAEKFFHDAGPSGRSKTDYTIAFKNKQPRQREEWLSTLLNTDAIRWASVSTAGRPANVYVHRDWCPPEGS